MGMNERVPKPAQADQNQTALLMHSSLLRIINLQPPCISPSDTNRHCAFWPGRNRISVSDENIACCVRQALRRADDRNLSAEPGRRSAIPLEDNGLDCAVRRHNALHNVVAAQTFANLIAAVHNQACCRKKGKRTARLLSFSRSLFTNAFCHIRLAARHWKYRSTSA